MAVDCLHEPGVIAFAKTFGASIGIFGAALAWLLNNALRWIVWRIGEWRSEYELIKGLEAEIASNVASERNWADESQYDRLLAALETDPGPCKPWAPYVAVVEANIVFDSVKTSINRLPADVITKVVEYYNLTSGLTAQLADFRTETFAQISHARQTIVIRRTYDLGRSVVAAAAAAADELAKRLQALQVLLGLGIAGAALALTMGVPVCVSAASVFLLDDLKPAVEWASACDLAPRSSPGAP